MDVCVVVDGCGFYRICRYSFICFLASYILLSCEDNIFCTLLALLAPLILLTEGRSASKYSSYDYFLLNFIILLLSLAIGEVVAVE